MRRVLVSGVIMAAMVGMLIFLRPADARAGQEAIFVVGQNQYTVDGQLYTADVGPFIRDGRIYLALRYGAYALGVAEKDIKWDPNTSKVSLRLGDKTPGVTGREQNLACQWTAAANGCPAYN